MLFILFLLFLYFGFKHKSFIYFQNCFLFSLFLLNIYTNYKKLFNSKIISNSYQNGSLKNNLKVDFKKPILLIILDEYSSPEELMYCFNDSSVYKFSKHLESKKWLVKNNFISNEVNTISSLNSLFNFNLGKNSTDLEYDKITHLELSRLSDSLKHFKISSVNYGIFDIGFGQPLSRLFFYPTNFMELILKYSIYPQIIHNTIGFNLSYLNFSINPVIKHNNKILNTLIDTLNSLDENKFIYAHLYMPHPPFNFGTEFKTRITTPENYLSYWKFSNKKFTKLLDSVILLNRYNIIITGDHGFRGSFNINPNKTFAAFYGFNQNAIDDIKCVQDIGSLIYCNYK